MALAGSAGLGCAACKLVTFVKFVDIRWARAKFPTVFDFGCRRSWKFAVAWSVDLSSGCKVLVFPRLESDASSHSIRDFTCSRDDFGVLRTPTIMQDVQRLG